jgi:hypothetical protein
MNEPRTELEILQADHEKLLSDYFGVVTELKDARHTVREQAHELEREATLVRVSQGGERWAKEKLAAAEKTLAGLFP